MMGSPVRYQQPGTSSREGVRPPEAGAFLSKEVLRGGVELEGQDKISRLRGSGGWRGWAEGEAGLGCHCEWERSSRKGNYSVERFFFQFFFFSFFWDNHFYLELWL